MDIRFCDQCDASIPELDVDRGVSARLDGRILCSLCLPRARRHRLLSLALQPLLLLAAVALGAAAAVWLVTPKIDDLNHQVSTLQEAANARQAVDPSVLTALEGLTGMTGDLAVAQKALEAAVANRDGEVGAALQDRGAKLNTLATEIREIREFLTAAAEAAEAANAGKPAASAPAATHPGPAEPASDETPSVDLVTWLPLAQDPDAGVRLSALVALEPSRDPRVLDAARRALGDSDAVVRAQGLKMVADRGDVESVTDVIDLLADRNARVRTVAHRALETLTGLDLDFDTTDSADARKGAVDAIRELLRK
jgi:hypothetical protein